MSNPAFKAAFRAGVEARRLGSPVSANPYGHRTSGWTKVFWGVWRRGWETVDDITCAGGVEHHASDAKCSHKGCACRHGSECPYDMRNRHSRTAWSPEEAKRVSGPYAQEIFP